jgi:hypothetical protein
MRAMVTLARSADLRLREPRHARPAREHRERVRAGHAAQPRRLELELDRSRADASSTKKMPTQKRDAFAKTNVIDVVAPIRDGRRSSGIERGGRVTKNTISS